MPTLGDDPGQESQRSQEMEVLGKHLKQIRLNREAIQVLQQMEAFHGNMKLEDMIKIKDNLYGSQKTPALFDMFKRLIAELPFITSKV
jgi:hypothetical protein